MGYVGFPRTGAVKAHFERLTQGRFDVRDYGAAQDGATDDTAAIRAALAAAVAATAVLAGPVVVDLPPGVSLVRPTTTQGFIVGSNVVLRGPGVLKVASDTGTWSKLFHGASPATDLSGFTLDGVGIDTNAAANSTATISAGDITTWQTVVYAAAGSGIVVRDCAILSGAVQTIVLGGAGGHTVAGNTITFAMRAGATYYDNTAIYSTADNASVTGNHLYGDGLVTPGRGATTAIEAHGANQIVTGNTIDGFLTGIIACPGTLTAGSASLTANTLIRVNYGILVWSLNANGIERCTAVGNTIGLANVTYNAVSSSGITLTASGTFPVANVTIVGNPITFQDEGASGRSTSTGGAVSYAECHGIGIRTQAAVTNFVIAHNPVTLAPAAGVYVGQGGAATYRAGQVAHNILVNCGQNLAFTADQRAAIVGTNTLTDVQFTDNVIVDTFATTRLGRPLLLALFGGTFTRVTHARNTVGAVTPPASSTDASVLGGQAQNGYTTATRPAAAGSVGMVIYVSDGAAGSKFQGSDGASWVSLG